MTTGKLALGTALLAWAVACTGSIGGSTGRPSSAGAASAGASTGAAADARSASFACETA